MKIETATSAVLGFLFTARAHRVVLIHKCRPIQLANQWNGLGGKIELGETPGVAMRREAHEEADIPLWVPWRRFALVLFRRKNGNHSVVIHPVHCFVALNDAAYAARTVTDEAVRSFPVEECWGIPLVDSVAWLLPLALQHRDLVTINFGEDTESTL